MVVNILPEPLAINEWKGKETIVSVEWPSKEAAQAFMIDLGYVPHLQARTEESVSHHFLVEWKDDLT